MKDFERRVSSQHCIHVMSKQESSTDSDDLDAVTSHPTNEVSRDSHPKPSQCMLTGIGNGDCLEACLDNFEIPPAEKFSGYVFGNGKCKGVEINDDHESPDSIEGSDNVHTISAGKRRCELTIMRSSKRQRLSEWNSSCSETFLEKGSSFRKWITNLLKGLSDFNVDSNFLCENSHKAERFEHENHHLRKIDHDIDLCRSRSFQSFFHAICSPSLRLHEKCERFDGTKEIKEALHTEETNREPFGEGTTSYGRNKHHIQTYTVKSHNRFSDDIVKVSSRSGSPLSQEKHKSNLEGNGISRNVACVLGKSSFPSSNNTGKPTHDIMNEGTPSELPTNSRSLSRNIWLARFSPSQIALEPVEENAGMNSSTKAFAIVDRNLSLGHNGVYTSIGPELTTVGQPFLKIHLNDCVNGTSTPDTIKNETNLQPKQVPVLQPARSFIKVSDSPGSDQELYNNSSMLCSGTGKELNDSMKTFRPTSRVMSSVICFFCGALDHSIRGCTEMVKYKLAYPLTSITTWEGEEDSCFCICCFGLDHWAISCPRKNIRIPGVASALSVDFGKLKEKITSHNLSENHNGTSSSQPAAIGSNYWFSNMRKNKIAKPTQPDARMIMTDVELLKNRLASSCGYCEPIENQMIPSCGPHNEEITTLSRGMFDKIQKLQLSRSDILRLLKVPEFIGRLEGFFLRLRFRKYDEELGGGYSVARISGVNQGRAHGRHEVQLLVNLEGSTLMVDSRYISNREFTEEEVAKWWFSAMNDNCNIPNEEELRLKVEEKNNFLSVSLKSNTNQRS